MIDTILKVYNANALGALSPWVAFGGVYAAATPIAMLGTAKAQALVLTAVANTPAAASPATLTATKSIISPDNNFQLIFNSTLREVPLKWDVFLQDSGGTGSLVTLS